MYGCKRNSARRICVFFWAAILHALLGNKVTHAAAMPGDSKAELGSLLHSLIALERDSNDSPNFVFCPLSVAAGLSLAKAGTRGRTALQLQDLLGSDWRDYGALQCNLAGQEEGQKNCELTIVDRLYASEALQDREAFRNFIQSVNAAGKSTVAVEAVNFQDPSGSAAKINDFIKRATRGHITDLVPEQALGANSSLVIVNAAYFACNWRYPFDAENSKEGIFYVPSKSGIQEKTVTFMSENFRHWEVQSLEEDGIKAVALSYKEPSLAFYAFQPTDIMAFEVALGSKTLNLDSIVDKMRSGSSSGNDVVVEIPRFKLDSANNRADVKRILRALGVTDLFQPGVADFSGISGDKSLYVSSILHQADIKIDELGTEATAATAIGINALSLPIPSETIDYFTFDGPFVFQVRSCVLDSDRRCSAASNDTVVFTGRVVDPTRN